MKCSKEMMRLYAVSDRSWTQGTTLYNQIEQALKGGVTCVQLREKGMDEESFIQEAIEIGKLCHAYNVPLIINDQVQVAIKAKADGVHVGQDDMSVTQVRQLVGPDLFIGVSAHNTEEAVAAVRGGADYLGTGAVFGSKTKNNVTPLSAETLRQITSSVDVPVVAIGGINENNIEKLTGSGVDGVAVVSAIFAAEDIEAQCRKLKELSERMVQG